MPVLVIPDVHERIDKLQKALKGRAEKAERIVFLGDWFDAFGEVNLDRLRKICEFINRNIDGIPLPGIISEVPLAPIPVEFLLGNHDCHYFFTNNAYKCSGYYPQKDELINQLIGPEVKRKFKVYTTVGPYTLSHAGFHPKTMHFRTPEAQEDALQRAANGEFHPMFSAGHARGGWARLGGPTWLDWRLEFELVPDVPQIVGHTHSKEVRSKGEAVIEGKPTQLDSWCIDTGCNHIAWIDGDEVRVEAA